MQAPHVTFWREEPGFELSRVVSSTHIFPRHFHEELYSIGLMNTGACYCKGPEFEHDTVQQGQACLINPGEIHSGVPVAAGKISYSMLYIHADLLRGLAEDLAQKPYALPEFSTMICTRQDIILSLADLVRTLTQPCSSLERESALIRATGDLLRQHGGVCSTEQSIGSKPIARAKELLSANLDSKVTLKDAAQVAGLSQYHFLRQFKRVTGISPHVFRTQQRVERARRLIRQGMHFADVAQATGFTDQSHFTNTFKHFMGATPGQYATASSLAFNRE